MVEFLDIDMDFFLDEVAHLINGNERLDSNSYHPIDKEEVIEFFEDKLGLTKSNKIKGRIITDHNEAFYFWRELINKGIIEAPFNVVHIDAHADLGLGGSSYTAIFTDILSMPVEERSETEKYPQDLPRPGIGDYLLFALACRWISSLTYVVHPKESGDDFIPLILERDAKMLERAVIRERKYNEMRLSIQLPCGNKESLNRMIMGVAKDEFYHLAKYEPQIPFTVTRNNNQIRPEKGFDYLVFCISPNYTPATADFIIDIITEYIQPI